MEALGPDFGSIVESANWVVWGTVSMVLVGIVVAAIWTKGYRDGRLR